MMMMLPQFHFERTRTPFSTPPSLPNLGGTDRRLVEDEVEVVLGAAGPPVSCMWGKGAWCECFGYEEARQNQGKGEGTCFRHGPSQAASTTLGQKKTLSSCCRPGVWSYVCPYTDKRGSQH